MHNKISFYEEVEIIPSNNKKNQKWIGKKGGVMGISEENGIIYGYSVKIYDEEFLLSFDKNEVRPTGLQRKQEDYY